MVRLKKRTPPPFMVENILKVYLAATPAEVEEGLGWYHKGREFCQHLAERHGLTVETVAGVLATLSPACPWERNLIDCQDFIRYGGKGITVTTYGANKVKARKILKGANPAECLGRDKVFNFWRCIAFPEDNGAVCVDRHAYSIAQGRTVGDVERGRIKNRKYDIVANAYKKAAENVSLLPSKLQAITWVSWRNQERARARAENPF